MKENRAQPQPEQPRNFWTVLSLRSSLEILQDGEPNYFWFDEDNLEEVGSIPIGKLDFVESVLREGVDRFLDPRLVLGLEGESFGQENLILLVPLKNVSAQYLIETLCLLPRSIHADCIFEFHPYIYKSESMIDPEIRFRVIANGRYIMNAPLSDSAFWSRICFKRLDHLQRKIGGGLGDFTLELPDPDF